MNFKLLAVLFQIENWLQSMIGSIIRKVVTFCRLLLGFDSATRPCAVLYNTQNVSFSTCSWRGRGDATHA